MTLPAPDTLPFVLASIVHTLDSFALNFGGGIGIRWYGLAYLTGFVLAWAILSWLARTGRCLLRPQQVGDMLTWLVAGVIVGGRLGHVLLYDQQLLWTLSSDFPWWGLLAIHKGGMSSHGGIVGVAIAGLLYARRIHIPFAHALDLIAFAAPPGLMLGRLANWVNGELWGRALPAAMQADAPWWSVKYPEEVLHAGFDPARLEPLREVVGPTNSLPESVYAACYAGREDIVRALEPMLTAHYPNNFLQALSDGPLLMAVLATVWWVPRKPGVVAGAFLLAYGMLRVMTESLRMPDSAALGGEGLAAELTAPVAISLAMALLGAIVIVVASSSRADPLGGLRPGTR